MLGHECYNFLRSIKEFEVFGTSRQMNSPHFFVQSKSDLEKVLDLNRFDYLINCIGVIKPNIIETNAGSVHNAIFTNSILPFEILEVAKFHDSRIIQIATDCVFSGKSGNYLESSSHDALDVYGKTKSLGEIRSELVLNLRCSIVGRELERKSSLLEWFLSRPFNSEVNGFLNHRWNGVTTYHYAKLVGAIIMFKLFTNGTFHIAPSDSMDKYSLLLLFQEVFSRHDLKILPRESDQIIDRTLSTIFPEFNKSLWNSSGFPTPPTIEEMLLNYRDYLNLRDQTSQ